MEQNQELKITTDSAAVKLLLLLIQLPMCALCFLQHFSTCLHFLKLHLTSQGHRNVYRCFHFVCYVRAKNNTLFK